VGAERQGGVTKRREEESKDEGPRSFTAFLAEVDDGSFVVELAEELQALVKDITEKAAAKCGTSGGEVTIKFVLKADAKGFVDVKPDVKIKYPPAIRGTSKFRATLGNNLTTSLNPKQEVLFREIPGGKAEVKAVDDNKTVKSL
jgi:hypothetical protein